MLLRVSPLTSPAHALPAFFASVFLSVATTSTLLFFFFWQKTGLQPWNEGKTLGISFRQGMFLATVVLLWLLFHIFGILTWWIGLMIALIFLLVELALQR